MSRGVARSSIRADADGRPELPLEAIFDVAYGPRRRMLNSQGARIAARCEGVMGSKTLEQRIAGRIRRKKANVFLREDFADLGGYDQVGRVLGGLVRKGKLLKFGQGLYARSQFSPFTGKPAPTIGIKRLAEEALSRLRIPVATPRWERAYNAGLTTQLPTGRVIGVRKRVRRKLGFGDIQINFERVA